MFICLHNAKKGVGDLSERDKSIIKHNKLLGLFTYQIITYVIMVKHDISGKKTTYKVSIEMGKKLHTAV